MSTKKTHFEGSFYPSSSSEVLEYIEYFNNKILDEGINLQKYPARSIVVPHAGYVYSGYTANIAYKSISEFENKRFILLGPSHHSRFSGLCISDDDIYPTPLGNLHIDIEYKQVLEKEFDFVHSDIKEHSTEVQLPFIKHYFPENKIIECVYSSYSATDLTTFVKFLLADENNIVIISTDLSHYYDVSKASSLDSKCIQAIQDLDLEALKDGCEACGVLGVYAILKNATNLNLTSKVLSYTTSADASGDNSSVVGYTSAIIY